MLDPKYPEYLDDRYCEWLAQSKILQRMPRGRTESPQVAPESTWTPYSPPARERLLQAASGAILLALIFMLAWEFGLMSWK